MKKSHKKIREKLKKEKNIPVPLRIPSGLSLATGKQRKFHCSYCSYMSDYRAKLNRHMRLHTGERPFTCDVCGRAFSRKDHLQKHLPTHEGRPKDHHGGIIDFLPSLLGIASSQHPYRCKLCGRGFIQKHHLRGMPKHTTSTSLTIETQVPRSTPGGMSHPQEKFTLPVNRTEYYGN